MISYGNHRGQVWISLAVKLRDVDVDFAFKV